MNVIGIDPGKIVCEFHVFGKPAKQGSKRYVGNGINIESDKQLRPWRAAVAAAAAEVYSGPLLRDVPIVASILFVRPRPKWHYGTGRNAGVLKASAPAYPTGRPDVLKMARAIEDALSGIVYHDDSLIVTCDYSKSWGDQFVTWVTLRRLEDGDS